MKRFLFICSRNQLRSPTAEQLFSTHPGLEVASAGTSPDAVTPLSAEAVEWADTIFVMEKSLWARRAPARLSPKCRAGARRSQTIPLPETRHPPRPRLRRPPQNPNPEKRCNARSAWLSHAQAATDSLGYLPACLSRALRISLAM